MRKDNIINSIGNGISFLAKSQQKNGGFLSFSSREPSDFIKAEACHSTFHSSLILSSLSALEQSAKVKKIEASLASFLLSQKSDNWTFNYWQRNSKESKTLPYPDDLDDTFCALIALKLYNPEYINSTALARIVKTLTLLEQNPGGPYQTWFVVKNADKVWQDIDLAVNSNIACFLSLCGISLPNLELLMEQAIEKRAYKSQYYPSPYPIIYFITRAYRGSKAEKIKTFLLKESGKLDGKEKLLGPLFAALLANALFRLEVPAEALSQLIKYLLANQEKDGSWPASAFCLDPAIKGQACYSGSPSLTTAFCLEALARHLEALNNKKELPITQAGYLPKEARAISKAVESRAARRFSSLDKDLKSQCLEVSRAIIKKDKDGQIKLMPYFFRASLRLPRNTIPDELVISLGLANLYGWIAYTIYDDFLDEEGAPKLLPVANICFKELIRLYENIFYNNKKWNKFFHNIIDSIESANAWEISHCRTGQKKLILPDYGNLSRLAERSIGHALGPAAILAYLKYGVSSKEVRNLRRFFNHFLIARQLHDDAHDWEIDLKKGHINSVGAMILKYYKKLNFQDNFPELQKIFWQKTVGEVMETAVKHARLAEKSLKEIPIINSDLLEEKLIKPLSIAAKNTLREQKETVDFLRNL